MRRNEVHSTRLGSIAFILATLGFAAPASGQWPACGVDLSRGPSGQYSPQIVSNGTGGAIVVWYDNRNVEDPLAYPDIFARAISASGTPLGTIDGTPICTAPREQSHPMLASDGFGGAIMAWQDWRNTSTSGIDIYAHRVDSSGNPLWVTDGYAVCTASGDQSAPQLVSDGAGGAIVAWHDLRNGPNWDIYVQRIDRFGTRLWATDGVPLCTASGDQTFPQLAPDGAGGAIVTWNDRRAVVHSDIYAARINASGIPLWTPNGVAVCTAGGDQTSSKSVNDGSRGAIVTWEDRRTGVLHAYAQRVDSSGAALWMAHGIDLSAPWVGGSPKLVSDEAGGAIVAWGGGASGSGIYAQRVDGAGTRLWPIGGVALCSANVAGNHQITPDGAGGALVAWQDFRTGAGYDVYAQSVNDLGAVGPTTDGVAVCNAPTNQWYPQLAPSGSGAIVTWMDERNAAVTETDIYATFVSPGGTTTAVSVTLTNAEAVAGGIRVQWSIPGGSGPLLGVIERASDGEAWRDLGQAVPVSGPSFAYTDYGVEGGRRYGYRMRLSDASDTWQTNEIWFEMPVTSAAPRSVSLARPYPSPSDGRATFRVGLPVEGVARLRIFDAAGRAVAAVMDGRQPAGWLMHVWNGRDASGRPVASGIYFAALEANGTTIRRKLVVSR